MASKRSRSNPKTRSMTSAPARARRFAFFGPPPVLEGEDAALYDDLVDRMCAAVGMGDYAVASPEIRPAASERA
jgi:hypothetical protein